MGNLIGIGSVIYLIISAMVVFTACPTVIKRYQKAIPHICLAVMAGFIASFMILPFVTGKWIAWGTGDRLLFGFGSGAMAGIATLGYSLCAPATVIMLMALTRSIWSRLRTTPA